MGRRFESDGWLQEEIFMGNPFLLQACLRLDKDQIPKVLELNKEYDFVKNGHRVYQIKVPMDLRTDDWDFLGRIIVTEYIIGNNQTKGKFILIKKFTEEENKIITKTFISEQELENILKNK